MFENASKSGSAKNVVDTEEEGEVLEATSNSELQAPKPGDSKRR